MGQQAIHSLAIGSIYALLTAGLTFMYGAYRSLYLAYGGLYALGGYVAWWAVRSTHPVWLALSVAILLCLAVGALLAPGLQQRRVRMTETSHLLFGLGGLICLEEIYRLAIGPYRLKVVALDSHQIHQLGPLMITDLHWLVFGATFVVFSVMHGFLSASHAGRMVYTFVCGTVPHDADTGQSRRLRLCAGGIGAALAGIGGVLGGLYFNDVHPTMGTAITHKILALALIGTLGSLQGAILAAFVFALCEGVFVPALGLSMSADVLLLIGLGVVSMGRAREAWYRPQARGD